MHHVQDVIRRPLKPGSDMPGKLLGNAGHLGGMGLDLLSGVKDRRHRQRQDMG